MRLLPFSCRMAGIFLTIFITFPSIAKKESLTPFKDDLESHDLFVNRSGAEHRDAQEFKLGQLGVLLPSYGREPLYLAYRALTLNRSVLEKQSIDTPERVYRYEPPPSGGLSTWLEQREAVSTQPLSREPDQYRSFDGQFYGKYLNCTDAAFNLATETLKSLSENPKIDKAALQEWVAAQDLVFDLCGDPVSAQATPLFPQALPANAPKYLRQLRQYQIAAANFYAGKYREALAVFDAISKEKAHPMRAWASHAGLRTLLRTASMDSSFIQRVREIRASNDAQKKKREAFTAAENHYHQKMTQIYGQITTRSNAILADKTQAAIHKPVKKLLIQAAQMIVPDQLFSDASANLGRFNKDADRSGELVEWTMLGDRLLGYGRNADLDTKLRKKHEYFDWIRTIQACTDNPQSPNYTDSCTEESMHALSQWKVNKSRPWLVASLMTAPQLTPELEPALLAARAIKTDAVEYLTVRYYMVKLLRLAGRRDEAKALADEVLVAPSYKISSRNRRNVTSANNLFRQERLALSNTEQEALTYLLRDSSRKLGADGDELLNRRLATKDLLRLAQNTSVDDKLRNQLLIAAWWRGDMTENASNAEEAARLLKETEPRLAESLTNYLKTSDAEERHYLLAKAALNFNISPQVFGSTLDLTDRRNHGKAADWWCSFDSADFKHRATIQRTPTGLPELTADARSRDAEILKLNKVGSASDWLAQVALKRVKTHSNDPYVRKMLEAVVASDEVDCNSSQGDALLNAAKETLSAMDSKQAPVSYTPNSEQFIARVNGRPIPKILYLAIIEIYVNKGNPDNAKLRTQVKEELIAKEILAMEASALGFGKLPNAYQVSSRDEGNAYLAQENSLAQAYVKKYLAEHPVADENVRNAFDYFSKLRGNKEYKVRHILVKSESDAKSIIDTLKTGGKFEELAKQSMDSGSKNKGGDLSWSVPNVYVHPFADAVTKLEKGKYTEVPVKTVFGYHVIRLDDVRDIRPLAFEEVKSELVLRMQQEMLVKHISELRGKAIID